MARRRMAVLVVPILLAACATEAGSDGVGLTGPQANLDHWHAAYGIYVCDEFLPDLPEFDSPTGIHTHGDGLVHIHPFSPEGAGRNATLDAFLRETEMQLDEGALVADGTRHDEGDTCGSGGEPAVVQVAWWDDIERGGEPTIVTDDFDELRFTDDGAGLTIAFAPEGAEIPRPPSVDTLASGVDADGPSAAPDPGNDQGIPDFPSHDPGVEVTDGFYPVVALAGAQGRPEPEAPCQGFDTLMGQHVGGVDGQCYALDLGSGVGSDAIESAAVERPQGMPQVSLVLTEDGIDRFNQLAATCFNVELACVMKRIAIVVNGWVVSAPTVTEPSFERDAITIAGDFTDTELDALAAALDPD